MDVLKLLPLFAVAAGLLLVLVTLGLYRAMRRPPRFTFAAALARRFPTDPADLDLGATQLSLRDAKGYHTPAWSIQGRNPAGPVVIMLHGFARSRYSSLELAPCFVDHASRLILPDLPGHGESAARCTSAGVTDWRDVLGFVEQVQGGGGLHVPTVLYGRSMGAGIAIAAAAHGGDRIAGVIAEGAYRGWAGPIRRRLRLRRYPAEPFVMLASLIYRLLVAGLGDFDRVKLAGRLRCPLLLLHGCADAVCAIDDAHAIAAAAPDATLVEFEAGQHMDLHRADPQRHQLAIDRFFTTLATTRPSHTAAQPEDAPTPEETPCLTHP